VLFETFFDYETRSTLVLFSRTLNLISTTLLFVQRRIRLVAGILSALGGLLLVAAVSWYANNIRIQYDIDTRLKATGSFSTQR